MSTIKHTDLFDFPAYEAALKEAENQTKAFGTELQNVLRRVRADQKGLLTELSKYADLLKQFNVAVNNAAGSLRNLSQGIDETKKRMTDSQAVALALNSTIDIQKQAVKELKAEYALQKQALEALKPSDADYQKNQQAILEKVKQTTAGIKAYNETLKNAKNSVGVAEGSYRAMVARLNELRNTLRNLPGAFDPVTGKLNKSNKEASQLTQEITKLDSAVKRADASMGIFSRNVGNYSGALKSLGSNLASSLLATLGVGTAFEGLRQVFDVNRDFDQLNNALKLVSGSSQQLGENQKLLTRIAQDYGLEIEGLTRAFNKFFASSTNAGLSADQTNRIFDQVSKVAANLKLTQDEVNSVFLAFAQIAGKGKVQAEELRGQLGERIPGAAAIAARALGITEKELSKLLETGKVTAVDFLPRFANELEKTFGKEEKISTLTAEINRFFNAIKTGVQNENLTAFLADTVRFFTDIVEAIKSGGGEVSRFFEAIVKSRGLITVEEFKNQRNAREQGIIDEKAYQARIKSIREDFLKDDRETQKKRLNEARELVNLASKDLRETVKLFGNNLATPAVKKANDEYNTQRSILKDLTQTYVELYKTKPITTDTTKKPKGKTAEQIARENATAVENLLKEQLDFQLAQEELFLETGLINQKEYEEKKLRLKQEYADKALAVEQGLGENADPSKVEGFKADRIKAEVDFTKSINKIKQDASEEAKRIAKEEDDYMQRLMDQDGLEQKNLANDRVRQRREAFEREVEIEKTTFELATSGRQKTFKEQKQHLERMLKIYQKYGEDVSGIIRALSNLEIQKNQMILDSAINLGEELGNTVTTIIADQQKARFDAAIKAIEVQKEAELTAAGNNAAARAAIEKKFAEKERQERIRQAKAEKQNALFNIAINTASGVARQWAQGTPFLIPFVLATGALQAAVVAARPLPQFRKGTKNAPRGLAVVGEEGSELIERNGQFSLTPNKATLVKLRGGEKIYTAKETTRIIERAEKQAAVAKSLTSDHAQAQTATTIIREKDINQTRALAEAVRLNESFLVDAFTRAVKNQPVQQQIMDERGMRKRSIELNKKHTSLNRIG